MLNWFEMKNTLEAAPKERLEFIMLSEFISRLIDTSAAAIADRADLLTELDQAIGDGDHGINMNRGFKAILNQKDKFTELPFSKALQKIGTTLVMHIGGAAGPLYGSLCLAMGKTAQQPPLTMEKLVHMANAGVAAVKKRGKSDVGCKTMLDVLGPVSDAFSEAASQNLSIAELLAVVREAADRGLEQTRDMIATKGRASFLGKRSRGHIDPGAQSSQILVHTVCKSLEDLLTEQQEQTTSSCCVGIVIVSHSEHVARGTADMVRQMVGDEVPLAWCGGNPERGLGTDVAAIKAAIEKAWNPDGVAILVDLGGAETNSEMAIEMLPEDQQAKVVICNAPIVEGSVMAATEAAGGGTLDDVRNTAEEMSPQ